MDQRRITKAYGAIKAAARGAPRLTRGAAQLVKDTVEATGASVINTVAQAADTLSYTGQRVTARNIAQLIMEDIGNSITVGQAAAAAAPVVGGLVALQTAENTARALGLGDAAEAEAGPSNRPAKKAKQGANPGLIDKESMAMLVHALKKNQRKPARRIANRQYRRKYTPKRRTYKRRYTPKRYVKRRYYRRRY